MSTTGLFATLRFGLWLILLSGVSITNADAELIGYWTFDKTADDAVGAHHGKLHNATFSMTARQGSHSVEFGKGALNRCVELGNWDPSPGDLTISMWVHPNRDSAGHQILMAKRQAWKAGKLRWQFVYQAPRKHGEITTSRKELIRFETTVSRAEFLCSLEPERWTYLVLSHRARSGRTILYVNGEAVGGEPQFMKMGLPKDAPLVIGGGHPEDWREVFDGRIDEVALWTEVLTPGEVKESIDSLLKR